MGKYEVNPGTFNLGKSYSRAFKVYRQESERFQSEWFKRNDEEMGLPAGYSEEVVKAMFCYCRSVFTDCVYRGLNVRLDGFGSFMVNQPRRLRLGYKLESQFLKRYKR